MLRMYCTCSCISLADTFIQSDTESRGDLNLEPTDRHSPCTFSADETPTDVDMLVVLDPPARGEVVGAQDAVIG